MVRVQQLSLVSLASFTALALLGCQTPETFADQAAEVSCEYQNECHAHLFENSCAALCEDDDQCGPGNRCNLLTSLCEDAVSHNPLDVDLLGEPCESDDDCGAQLCGKVYDSFSACESYVLEFYADKEEHCEFNADAAAECLRLSRERSCGEPGPEICRSVYADSTCYY